MMWPVGSDYRSCWNCCWDCCGSGVCCSCWDRCSIQDCDCWVCDVRVYRVGDWDCWTSYVGDGGWNYGVGLGNDRVCGVRLDVGNRFVDTHSVTDSRIHDASDDCLVTVFDSYWVGLDWVHVAGFNGCYGYGDWNWVQSVRSNDWWWWDDWRWGDGRWGWLWLEMRK